MDYKEKYEKALERMKSWARGEHPECFTEAQKAAEFVFPELKESEDDKIRNFISNELACLRATDEKGTVRYNELTEAITWLEKQGEQKPAEWSEEDKKMFVNIKACLRNANKDYSAELDWLKSLKPQKQWKPSEEQMDALGTYIYNPQYFSSPDPRMELVESVYKDLKKLREE